MTQTKETLNADLLMYKEWLEDEERRMNSNPEDTYLVGLLKVRCNMWKNCITYIEEQLAKLEEKDQDDGA